MIVPVNEINPETLRSLAESFVLREGTDYGEHEVDFSDKVQDVLEQLASGDVLIEYSELHESVDLIAKSDFAKRQRDTDA